MFIQRGRLSSYVTWLGGGCLTQSSVVMPSVGDAVIDGYKPTASWFDNGIEWLGDVAEFYKERGAIEREAASKLASLASKFHNKKASVTAAVSVGSHPLTTPGSLESTSMESWTSMLNQTEQISEERKKMADYLQKHVSEELLACQQRFEHLSRTYRKFNDQLEEHRDDTYHKLKKSKTHYDSCCEAMESARAKSKKSIENKENEMYKAKNSYIVQINVSNRIKDKHYHDDLPEMLDAMQAANEARVAQTNRLITAAIECEKSQIKTCNELLDTALASIQNNHPSNDTNMFVEHNANAFQWTDPTDFFFEPSPIWHDNDRMFAGNDDSQRFLVALLNDAGTRSTGVTQDSQKAMQVYENAKQSVGSMDFAAVNCQQAYPVLHTEAKALQTLIEAESARLAVEVEIEAIEAGTADVDMSHIPQTRVKVQRSLFGRKKEVVEVVGEATKHGHSSLGLTSLLARTGLSNSKSSGGDGTKALVLYNFEASGAGELSVTAGATLELLAGDDGTGWVKLVSPSGTGLVPASYVEILFGGKEANAAPPPPPPTRGSQDHKVIALYDYEGQDPTQLTIRQNDVITVVSGDQGGWTTGVLRGEQGIFPTAYVRPL